jgi:hypothetical protein
MTLSLVLDGSAAFVSHALATRKTANDYSQILRVRESFVNVENPYLLMETNCAGISGIMAQTPEA